MIELSEWHAMSGHQRYRHMRNNLLDRQGGRCRYCLDELTASNATTDHIDPVEGKRKKRQHSTMQELLGAVASCLDCNRAKADMPLREFIAIIASDIKPASKRFISAWDRRRINCLIVDKLLEGAK